MTARPAPPAPPASDDRREPLPGLRLDVPDTPDLLSGTLYALALCATVIAAAVVLSLAWVGLIYLIA